VESVSLTGKAVTEEIITVLAEFPSLREVYVLWSAAHPWMDVVVNGSRRFHGVDFAAERRAAEWFARHLKIGYVRLSCEQTEVTLSANQRTLPQEDFFIQSINNYNMTDVGDDELAVLAEW